MKSDFVNEKLIVMFIFHSFIWYWENQANFEGTKYRAVIYDCFTEIGHVISLLSGSLRTYKSLVTSKEDGRDLPVGAPSSQWDTTLCVSG